MENGKIIVEWVENSVFSDNGWEGKYEASYSQTAAWLGLGDTKQEAKDNLIEESQRQAN